MSSKDRSNPLALAVLALVFERPRHPYEMAVTLKRRHKHESIKLRYGTLYTVIELLALRGFIRPKETSRDGKRPERTVYALTPAGREELMDWMRDLVAEPAKEFLQFEAALSLLPVLPPNEAVGLMRERALRLTEQLDQTQVLIGQLSNMTFGDMTEPNDEIPAPLLGQKFPAIFIVETEYRLALLKAERDFVNELVRRVTEDGWGPVSVWQGMQVQCEGAYLRENGIADATAVELEAERR